jgi:glycosyltransferase involved in cell wall biosynthesis
MKQVSRAPTVAVVIPTYNRARLLQFAIDSVLGQTHRPDDIVVVNDGSTDTTAALLQSYDGRIRCLGQENKGKAAALNNALANVASDYIWIMDDDDCAFPDALERHMAFLKSHPEVDFSYSGLYFFEGEEAPPPLSRCSLWQPPDIAHAEFFIRAMERFPANLQTMLVPRACYRTVGAHDESLKFGEDYDIILRLARRYRAARLGEPTIFLRRHSGARGPASDRRQAEEKLAAWRTYNRKIFEKLRRQLTLDEYLPRASADSGALTSLQTRRALLQRACIMARRGLYEESLDDLALCISRFRGRQRLTPDERAICTRMLNFDDDVQPLSSQFVRDVTRLLRRRAPNLLGRVLAGLYWGFLREARAGNFVQAAKLGLYLAQALALVGAGRLRGNRRRGTYKKSSSEKKRRMI